MKVCVIDANGRVVEHDTIYPHPPQKQWSKAVQILNSLCKKHKVELIAIGNGAASRETEKLADEIIKTSTVNDLIKVLVSEAGASVYSASKQAEEEFPNLDVTIRRAGANPKKVHAPTGLTSIDVAEKAGYFEITLLLRDA